MTRRFVPLVALLFAAFTVNAATEHEFSDWDDNGNGKISQDEWSSACNSSDLFADWDMDNDGLIDDDEYSTGLFQHWDVNDDGVLEESEWVKANDNWLSDYDTQFSAWDSDDDGYVEYHEYEPIIGSTSHYADSDANNTLYIEKDEFCESLFARADVNNDESITVGEFDHEIVNKYADAPD